MPRGQQAWRTGKGGLRMLARVTPEVGAGRCRGHRCKRRMALRSKCAFARWPMSGAANRSVESVVARWLGLPKSRVAVALGGKSRIKTLDIDGEPDELDALIAAHVAAL